MQTKKKLRAEIERLKVELVDTHSDCLRLRHEVAQLREENESLAVLAEVHTLNGKLGQLRFIAGKLAKVS